MRKIVLTTSLIIISILCVLLVLKSYSYNDNNAKIYKFISKGSDNKQINESDTIKKIKLLLAEDSKKEAKDIKVIIIKENDEFVRGQAMLGLGGPYQGGMFLVAKNSDKWELDYNGHGEIPCEKLQKNNYPEEYIIECKK